ncbi:FAD-dependent pyridine nucleotide-disulfide oxidoreductase [Caballeronia udeis]|uniref:FAD-dependent pyridine nucleotide-disulfide oxidoreductase n=1 Tax=Caballeronia udeis TaxID=1232866 RepID=A0A158HEQ0_9BURK|nr:FAD-dependent oxidoreductase [Caballeronia udeis]SAL42627.1 FAD-dependent pyridine nucleotide-disulfide oxidoreductase [Caballeronia udeis]
METILIIGAGQAGGRAAETLRAQGFDGSVVLAGDEQHRPYERPALSKTVLTATDDNDCFSAWLHSSDFYETNNIDWIADSVELLDVRHRTATFRSGRSIRFDKCLITTGGRARRLPGTPDSRHVFALRTLQDAMRVRTRMVGASSVAVIGGGFLGLEFAASARARGIDVTVVEAGEQLLGRALPREFSERLRTKHEQNGVRFMLGAKLISSTEEASGVTLSIAPNVSERFDFVVVAIGQEPNDALARASGLTTGNGIHVDTHCRTSADGFYAAGDCANFPFGVSGRRLRLESWQNAQDQAIVAARNMLGESVEYRPGPWFWTDQYDWNIQMLGMLDGPVDQWIERQTSIDKTLLMGLRNNAITYALAVNNGGELRAIRRLVEQATQVDPEALADPGVKLRQLERQAHS